MKIDDDALLKISLIDDLKNLTLTLINTNKPIYAGEQMIQLAGCSTQPNKNSVYT